MAVKLKMDKLNRMNQIEQTEKTKQVEYLKKRARIFLLISALAFSMTALTGCCPGENEKSEIQDYADIDLSADNIVICDESELKGIAKAMSEGNDLRGKTISLSQDIELKNEEEYLPLGNNGTAFAGVFNGNGHRITGIDLKSEGNAAIFDTVEGIVCNLCVEDGVIEGEKAGGIAVRVADGGAILNCAVLAEVTSDNAGGIAAECEGKIVNCLVFPYFYKEVKQRKECPEGIALGMTANDKDCETIENCYTGFGRLYEIMGFGSDQMIDDSFNRACTNLNDRINELTEEYTELSFNKWENGGRWLMLSNATAKRPAKVRVRTVEDEIIANKAGDYVDALYDISEHAYVAEDVSAMTECVVVDEDGQEYSYSCLEGAECYMISYDNMSIMVKSGAEIERADAKLEKSDAMAPDRIERVAYFDNNHQLTDVLEREYINAPGEYIFSGDMNAQLVVDGEMEGDVSLCLDGANIRNLHDPAIIIEGKNKKSTVTLKINDNTSNSIDGSEYIDIFAKKHKHEGAISSDRDVIITGDTGALAINAVLEGIESEKGITLDGGHINITSVDDAVAAEKVCTVNDGYYNIDAGDDAFDCEQIVTNGGTISIVAPSEHDFNGELLAQGGYIASGCSVGGSCSKDSTQGKIRIMLPSDNRERTLVITDKDDKPIMGYEYNDQMDRVSFSFLDMLGKEYHLYLAENVKGTQLGRMFTDIEEMSIIKKLSNDEGDVFTMTEAKYIIDGLK